MTTWAFMKRSLVALFCCLAFNSSRGIAEENGDGKDKVTAKAEHLQKIRDRIIWYDDEKTRPHLLPEEVVGLVPIEELPIPRYDREAISMWVSFVRDWRSPTGQRYPECTFPRRADNSPVAPEAQITIEQAVAEGPVSMLVAIDKTTKGIWFNEGIFQYNEISILKILVGAGFPYQDPLKTRAFLTAGGEIIVEGTRLCTISPFHATPPAKRDTYLVVGAPDDRGIFHANFYFRVEGGNIVSASYSSLKQPERPVSLERILAGLPGSKEAQ